MPEGSLPRLRRVALIGAGYISHIHAAALRTLPGTTVAAVAPEPITDLRAANTTAGIGLAWRRPTEAADGAVLNGGAALGTMNFGGNGLLAANVTMNASIPLANGAASPLAFPITFPVSDMTQFGVNFSVSQLQQDGFTTGRLAGFAIGSDGVILGRYTNGQTRAQGQIVLANFINPQGLVALGGNEWAETSESGQPLVSTPGSGNLGTLQSGALEEANVDLTEELVKMITAQRVYQANAQTIRTQDQVMQTIVNLR